MARTALREGKVPVSVPGNASSEAREEGASPAARTGKPGQSAQD